MINLLFYELNGQFILSWSEEYSLKIWDTNIQKCIYTFPHTAYKINSFLSIDNTILVDIFTNEISSFNINLDIYNNVDY